MNIYLAALCVGMLFPVALLVKVLHDDWYAGHQKSVAGFALWAALMFAAAIGHGLTSRDATPSPPSQSPSQPASAESAAPAYQSPPASAE